MTLELRNCILQDSVALPKLVWHDDVSSSGSHNGYLWNVQLAQPGVVFVDCVEVLVKHILNQFVKES